LANEGVENLRRLGLLSTDVLAVKICDPFKSNFGSEGSVEELLYHERPVQLSILARLDLIQLYDYVKEVFPDPTVLSLVSHPL
jgi:hypothetical protein